MKITLKPYSEAGTIIQQALVSELVAGPTLLLISAGSATAVYAELANTMELDLVPGQLVVGLVDERYDLDPNHVNSNDVAIRATGFITRLEQQGAIYSPILHGHSLEEETLQYNYQLTQFIRHEQRHVIIILGIGPDGHIAGILPDQTADRFNQRFGGNDLVCGYENDGPYPLRITSTMDALKSATVAIVLVKDEAKLPIVQSAIDPLNRPPLNLTPAAILQDLPNVIIAATGDLTPLTSNKEPL